VQITASFLNGRKEGAVCSPTHDYSLGYDVIQQLVKQYEIRLPTLMDEIKEKLILSFQKQEI
jgi:hypothetical protein